MRIHASHMMCTRCERVAEPDTWVPGSDLVEFFAWCCLGVPGLVYCAWRHLGRLKLCPFCGSGELIREARRSQRLASAPTGAAVHSRGARLWPVPMRAPRQRLRRGALLAAAGIAGLAACLGFATGGATSAQEFVAQASFLVGGCFVMTQFALLQSEPERCRAWDEDGRTLRIEQV